MAMDPKELIEDWISTLDIEKIAPWNPAGSPIFMICFTLDSVILIFSRHRRYAESERARHCTISTAEMHSDTTVAVATPATPIEKTITKTRFSTTLTAPANSRKYSGLLVSPTARRIAAPKLYVRVAGIPIK